ncbi:MAG: helix-turn-helix domain-containing protein [bacterium]
MSKVTAGNVVELMVARYREDYEARGVMDVGEVALVLGVSVATVKRFTDTGKLACARTVGGHRRFTPQQVADYLNATTSDAVLVNPNKYPVYVTGVDLASKPGDKSVECVVRKNDDGSMTVESVRAMESVSGVITDGAGNITGMVGKPLAAPMSEDDVVESQQ